MNAVKALLAAPAVALLITWAPSNQADSSFSFRFYGGEHLNRGHFHGGYQRHYYGYRPVYRHYGHRYERPGSRRYRRHGTYWMPVRPYRSHGHRHRNAPACIYTNGYRYCR